MFTGVLDDIVQRVDGLEHFLNLINLERAVFQLLNDIATKTNVAIFQFVVGIVLEVFTFNIRKE